MPLHLHLDFETFSLADITEVGAYRYAFDPSTEILCAAMALGDDEPFVWYRRGVDFGKKFERFKVALEDPDVLIYAHNAMFEAAICQALVEKTWGIKCPALSRFRCTLSLARRAALPGSLDRLGDALNLSTRKDTKGKALIRKFSMMQGAKKPTKKNPDGIPPRRIRPEDDPEAFAEFMQYCAQDVRVEQQVVKALSYFDDPGNNSNFTLTEVINARGVAVNLVALRHAQKLVEEETEIVSERFRKLTGFNVTQNARLLGWCEEQGYNFENLQADTVDAFIDDADDNGKNDVVVQALRMKQSLSYVAVKKIPAMLACAGPYDNRIRGMLNHHGATTGRWSHGLVQLGNMKRPTIKHSEDAYREICSGISREMLELCYGPPLEVISSCIRHFVHDCERCYDIACWCTGDGTHMDEREMLDADYAAIEARIVAWLAGQEDAIEQYRAYDAAPTKEEKNRLDPYRILASHIYTLPLDEVEKFPHRLVGKHAKLGCGFGMGAPKFRGTVKKQGGYDLPQGLEDTAVEAYRDANRAIVKLWSAVEDAAKEAILCKGERVKVKPKRRKGESFETPLPVFQDIQFLHENIGDIPFLLCRLPSGRKLAYPRPRLKRSDKWEGATSIVFFGHIKGVQWGDVDTYGGKLVENITQAVAADIMAYGAHNAERAGYEIATLIHDQALAYYREGQTPEQFEKLLTQLPPWAKGLPIAAEGGLVPFYKKD